MLAVAGGRFVFVFVGYCTLHLLLLPATTEQEQENLAANSASAAARKFIEDIVLYIVWNCLWLKSLIKSICGLVLKVKRLKSKVFLFLFLLRLCHLCLLIHL